MLRQSFSLLKLCQITSENSRSVFSKLESAFRPENNKISCSLCGVLQSKPFHSSLPRSKTEDRRMMLASLPVKDEGTAGEKIVDIDKVVSRLEDVFPDEDTPTRLFNGIPFAQLPIFNIKVSKNNTIMTVSNHKGTVKMIRSCGMEGFKNTRKGTNIAAQATAITLGTKAVQSGYKTVRVKIQGLGPGRVAAIKGLQMGGLDIVSITDTTRVSWNPARARKQRRL